MSILFSARNLTIFSRRYQINYKDVELHSPKFQAGDASNILSEVEVFLSEKIPCGYFSWEKTEQRNGSSSKKKKKKHTKRKKTLLLLYFYIHIYIYIDRCCLFITVSIFTHHCGTRITTVIKKKVLHLVISRWL